MDTPNLTELFGAISAGNWKLAGAFAVLVVVWLVRKYGGKLVPSLASGPGAWIVSVALGAVGAVATEFTGDGFSGASEVVSVILAGAQTGLIASGVYSGAKTLTKTREEDAPPPPSGN